MYLITKEMLQSLMTELLKIKIGIAVCLLILLIMCVVYFVERWMKGE